MTAATNGIVRLFVESPAANARATSAAQTAIGAQNG